MCILNRYLEAIEHLCRKLNLSGMVIISQESLSLPLEKRYCSESSLRPRWIVTICLDFHKKISDLLNDWESLRRSKCDVYVTIKIKCSAMSHSENGKLNLKEFSILTLQQYFNLRRQMKSTDNKITDFAVTFTYKEHVNFPLKMRLLRE